MNKPVVVGDDNLLKFTWVLADIVINEIWDRNNLMHYFISYGGIMSFITLIFNSVYDR